jgi:hypothetical protein
VETSLYWVIRLGGAAIGGGVPDRVRKYPVFVWERSALQEQIMIDF